MNHAGNDLAETKAPPPPPLPPQIERWDLRPQPYKLTIQNQPANKNPADYMSRHPSKEHLKSSREQRIVKQYVNFIEMSLEEVMNATANDKTILKAMEFVRTGRWFELETVCDPNIQSDELRELTEVCVKSHSDNLLMRGDRIVLPTEKRTKALSLAHEGHQGIIKTKSFIKFKL